jgi:hypothetical protein
MEMKPVSIIPRGIVFPDLFWSEFLVPTKINPGLIVFKKEQHHTQILVRIGSNNSV